MIAGAADRALVRRRAGFDESGRFRYWLTRRWDDANPRKVCFVMLNPSSADGRLDDPTIRACMRLARGLGFGGLAVVNLFARIATDPRDLFADPDPIGSGNDRALFAVARRCDQIVAAWGNRGSRFGRDQIVLERLLRLGPVWRLGATKFGRPRHPLYAPSASPLERIGYGDRVSPASQRR